MSETTCLACGIETDGMYHQCIVRVSARGARKPMYQIYLVIKEDMNEEVSSMLISGHGAFEEATTEIVKCFEDITFCKQMAEEAKAASCEPNYPPASP